MNLIQKLLAPDLPVKSANATSKEVIGITDRRSVQFRQEIASPYVADRNFMKLFLSVPEVFFPIDFIASRIAKAHFELKRSKDDSVVWCNRRMDKILSNPNCLMGWSELIYTHFVYKLATGNGFVRAAMPESLRTPSASIYRNCNHFWPMPAPAMKAVPSDYRIPLFGICDKEDIIKEYRLELANYERLSIPTWQIWHDRDGIASLTETGNMFLKSPSRLLSVMKAISNLIAVYEARNVIYVKRGGIGFLVSLKRDETGSTAMEPKEKKEIEDYLDKSYGLGVGQRPIGVTDVPLSFVRTNLSISELQPFEETLQDAITIAGAYGIPDVLVPRKDHSTFNNQANAEKTAYCGVIIPMAQQFCREMTSFLGLDRDGLYLDCNFSDVDCLQVGLKEAEQVKKLINDRCRVQFADGLISFNDWRAQIHESQLDIELYPWAGKLKFEMTDEELALIAKIQGNIVINQNQPSTGESNHEREDEESESPDEDK